MTTTATKRRTPTEWDEKIAELEAHVDNTTARVATLKLELGDKELNASDGIDGAKQAVIDIRADLARAKERHEEATQALKAARDRADDDELETASEDYRARQQKVSKLVDQHRKKAIEVQACIEDLNRLLPEMSSIATQAYRLIKSRDLLSILHGENFTSRLALSLAPPLAPYGLATVGRDHPRYGEQLTTRAPDGDEALKIIQTEENRGRRDNAAQNRAAERTHRGDAA